MTVGDPDIVYTAPSGCNFVTIINRYDSTANMIINLEGQIANIFTDIVLYPGISWTSALPYKATNRVCVVGIDMYGEAGTHFTGQVVFGVGD
jgi:hypothetical protein